jgi:hypothetical protein
MHVVDIDCLVLMVDHHPVDHDLDRVFLCLCQFDGLVHVADLAIHPDSHESLAPDLVEDRGVLSLAVTNDWTKDHEPRAVRQGHQLIDHLLRGLMRNGAATVWAVRMTDASPKQSHVIVDLGDGTHRRPRIATRALLVDRDRRGQTIDVIDIRFFHLAQELPGIGGKGLDIPPLPFGKYRVECQG